MRALGFDDVLFPSATHAGLLTYPVALALAEQENSQGKELLLAVITAYEILGKMVMDEDPARAPHRPSMPFGPFAGVTAASRLLGLSGTQTAEALGYAADSAMGLKEGNEQQPTHVYGLIARNAITSALLARSGGQTSSTILEGKYGFYATLIGRHPDADAIVGRLGKDPEILRATQKRFPGTAMNIVPVELALALVQQQHLNSHNVSRVEFELPEDRNTFEDSISVGPYPTRTQAESSIPFQTAIILLDGRIDFARYEQPNDPQVLQLTRRVHIRLAPHANSRYARVTMFTRDGREFKSEGNNFIFPPLDARSWLTRDGAALLPPESLEEFITGVTHLEEIENVRPLIRLLVPVAAPPAPAAGERPKP
jgi:2-methylcitrate dehydratase PrpD